MAVFQHKHKKVGSHFKKSHYGSMEASMLPLSSGFIKFKVDDLNHVHKDVDSSRNMKKFTKAFKCNCKILSCMCIIISARCNLWVMVLTFKVRFNLIIKEIWKKLLIHSNINVGFKIVTCF
jgi:hypothetical protein